MGHLWILSAILSLTAFAGVSDDLVNAPPAFTLAGKHIIPVDFQTSELDLSFDVAAKTAVGRSRIEFRSAEAGHPMLDLNAEVTDVRLNGRDLGAGGLPQIDDPDNVTKFRYVAATVEAGSTNTLEVTYRFPADRVTFTEGGIRMGFFMSDVGSDRDFLEAYAPSNFEFDHFRLEVHIAIHGGKIAHHLFSNGTATKNGRDDWSVSFPGHFTTSSFYLHVTDRDVTEKSAVFAGNLKSVPVTIYADTASDADAGLANALRILKELETDYGPFAHEKLVAYITADGGGMEYCGATMTSLYSMGHELTHSYFARGYMPANGNAGWIDEAIASWRDEEYPTEKTPPVTAANLAGFSPYRRMTPEAAYTDGMSVIAHLDHVVHGMKPVLREFFARAKYQVVTTPQFQGQLESITGMSLKDLFAHYVYGKAEGEDDGVLPRLMPGFPRPRGVVHHPRPFTHAELARLR